MVEMNEVACVLRTFFDPRELKTFTGELVSFGFEWSVICEPHDHWRVRVAKRNDGQLDVSVSHPGEGSTLDRVFPSDFNFGEVIGLVSSAVPVKGEV